MHSHHKGQLLYAEGGIVHIFIQEKHWYLPARCFMWIPAEVPHSILTYSKKVELYNIYFRIMKEDSPFFSRPNIYFANDLLREMILYTKSWFGRIEKSDPAKYYFLRAIKENLPQIESTRLPILMQHPFLKILNCWRLHVSSTATWNPTSPSKRWHNGLASAHAPCLENLKKIWE